jgi:bacterioferritin (cytochrome b1)
MGELKQFEDDKTIPRDRLAELLNEDLSREYQAIIGYVVYSQVLKGAEFMNIADQLELHAHQELKYALTISRQIDYLGKMPSVNPSRSGHRKKQKRCCDLISITKMKLSAIIESAFGNVKRSANMRSRSRSVRS